MGPFSFVKLSAKSLVEFDMASQLEFDISEKYLPIFPSRFLVLMHCLLFCVVVPHLWTNGKALLLIFDFVGNKISIFILNYVKRLGLSGCVRRMYVYVNVCSYVRVCGYVCRCGYGAPPDISVPSLTLSSKTYADAHV